MADFVGEFEVKIGGLDGLVDAEAYCSFDTEREENEPFSDGRRRGHSDVVVGASLDKLIIGPISYDRSGAIGMIGAEQVSEIESAAFDSAGN